jgi:hypothetical protein
MIIASESRLHSYAPWRKSEYNWTPYVTEATMSTNKHGYSSLVVSVDLDDHEVAGWYERLEGYLSVISPDGRIVWEGIIEDFSYQQDELSVVAYGAWSYIGRQTSTVSFSIKNNDAWKVLGPDATSGGLKPELYTHELKETIYITPKTGEVIGTTGITQIAIFVEHDDWGFDWPDRIMFDYEQLWSTTGTPSGYRMVTACYTGSPWSDYGGTWTQGDLVWSLQGNGSTQSGSVSATVASGTRGFFFRLQPAPSDTITFGQAGLEYVKISNLRIIGGYFRSSLTTMSASDAVHNLTRKVGSNAAVAGDWTGIQTTTTDIDNLSYSDTPISKIFDDLAEREGYEVAVWDENRLEYRPKGQQAKTWIAQVSELSLETTLASIVSQVRVKYEVLGYTFRTSANPGSTPRPVGIDYYTYVQFMQNGVLLSSGATTEANAETYVADQLEKLSPVVPRARIEITGVRHEQGGSAHKWEVRAGDYLVVNATNSFLERESTMTFLLGSTDYSILTDELTVELERLLPTNEAILAY